LAQAGLIALLDASLIHKEEIMSVLDYGTYPDIPGTVAQEFRYKGYWGCDCICGLQCGHNPQTGHDFIILTELPSNKGTSVTNMVEHLATEAIARLGLDPSNTLIFEYYPARGKHYLTPETWDLVSPDWRDGVAHVPSERHMWKRLTRQEALELMGVDGGNQ